MYSTGCKFGDACIYRHDGPASSADADNIGDGAGVGVGGASSGGHGSTTTGTDVGSTQATPVARKPTELDLAPRGQKGLLNPTTFQQPMQGAGRDIGGGASGGAGGGFTKQLGASVSTWRHRILARQRAKANAEGRQPS